MVLYCKICIKLKIICFLCKFPRENTTYYKTIQKFLNNESHSIKFNENRRTFLKKKDPGSLHNFDIIFKIIEYYQHRLRLCKLIIFELTIYKRFQKDPTHI